jgi:hypothetical protein
MTTSVVLIAGSVSDSDDSDETDDSDSSSSGRVTMS